MILEVKEVLGRVPGLNNDFRTHKAEKSESLLWLGWSR